MSDVRGEHFGLQKCKVLNKLFGPEDALAAGRGPARFYADKTISDYCVFF